MVRFCDPFRSIVPAIGLKGSKKRSHPGTFSLRAFLQNSF